MLPAVCAARREVGQHVPECFDAEQAERGEDKVGGGVRRFLDQRSDPQSVVHVDHSEQLHVRQIDALHPDGAVAAGSAVRGHHRPIVEQVHVVGMLYQQVGRAGGEQVLGVGQQRVRGAPLGRPGRQCFARFEPTR
jgi:hypothetical protein